VIVLRDGHGSGKRGRLGRKHSRAAEATRHTQRRPNILRRPFGADQWRTIDDWQHGVAGDNRTKSVRPTRHAHKYRKDRRVGLILLHNV
jgi:hypothetical protein